MLELTISPKPKEIPVEAVPMRIAVKSLAYRRAISSKAPPEEPEAIPIEEREWTLIFCVKHPSRKSFEISSRAVKILRHSPELRESDGAIPWKTLTCHCRWFEQTVKWTVDDWNTCVASGRTRCDVNILSTEKRPIQYIAPRLLNNVLIFYGWLDYIYHVR